MPEIKIRNAKDLEKVLKLIAKNALEDTGKKTTKLVKDRIDKDVYGKFEPSEYIRTYELRESVAPSDVEDKGNSIEISIEHDFDKIGSYPPNQHYTVGKKYAERYGTDSSKYVPWYVHDGESGDIFGSEGEWMEPRPYMDNAKDDMKNGKFKEFMEESLNEKGIKTE